MNQLYFIAKTDTFLIQKHKLIDLEITSQRMYEKHNGGY